MVALRVVVGGKLASTYRYRRSVRDSKLVLSYNPVLKSSRSVRFAAEPVSHLGCDPMV